MASSPSSDDPLGLVAKYGAQNKNHGFLWDEKVGGYLSPDQVASIQQTVTIDGKVVPAGHIGNRSGADAWIPYSKQELQNLAKYNTPNPSPQQKSATAIQDKQVAASNPAAPTPASGSSGSSFDPSAGQPAAANIWDQFIGSANSPIQGSDQITTEFNQAPSHGLKLGSRADDPTNNSKQQSASQILQEFAQSDPSKIRQIQQQLLNAGASSVTVNGIADPATLGAYGTLLQATELSQKAGHNLTPDDVLNQMASANVKNKAKTQVSTQAQVNLTNPVQARNTLLTAMTDRLGRKPTDAEIAQFTQALNAYEQQNPTNTTTNTTTDATGNVKDQATTTTDKGTGTLNFTRDFADQYVTSNNSAEYAAAQHLGFFNIALNALGGGGPVAHG